LSEVRPLVRGFHREPATIFSEASQRRNRIVTCIADARDMQEDEKRRKKIRVTEEPEVHVYPVEDGYVAEGPGFYVWDEDWSDVIRAVADFARGSRKIARTSRMLWIRPELDPFTAS
jgi:hypothetical protein